MIDDLLLAVARAALAPEGDYAAATHAILARRTEFLLPARSAHADAQASALDQWASAFDGLELLTLLCSAIARFYLPDQQTAIEEEDAASVALHDLFWSGHLLCGEILTLLRAGYSTGALARWRALHETTTRAEFISRAGTAIHETARRYLNHEIYRQNKEIELYQGWVKKFDPAVALPKEDMSRLASIERELVDEHGQVFRGEFGWAHEHLKDVSTEYQKLYCEARRLRGPQFGDLEAAIRPQHDDPHYLRLLHAQASAAVHAAPRASADVASDGEIVVWQGPNIEALALSPAGAATVFRLQDLAWACHVPDDGEIRADC